MWHDFNHDNFSDNLSMLATGLASLIPKQGFPKLESIIINNLENTLTYIQILI